MLMRHENSLLPMYKRKGIILITCEIIFLRQVRRKKFRKDELNFVMIRSLTILSFQSSQTWKHLPCKPFQWMLFCSHTYRRRSVMALHCLESDLACLAKEQWANGDSLKENDIWFCFNHLIYLFPKVWHTGWIAWHC